jgi:hypothetical protein
MVERGPAQGQAWQVFSLNQRERPEANFALRECKWCAKDG